MKPIIVFFGNTKYSAIGQEIIHKHFPLQAVVTIPDRINKQKTITSPVKKFAIENRIPVIETDELSPEVKDKILAFRPDFLIVEDYGLIIPKTILEIPIYASLNIHHSLLPKYRGAAPAPFAILAGEKISGVSVIEMTSKVDAGDIIAQEKYTLRPDETTDSLLTTLNSIGGRILLPVITDYINGCVNKTKQAEDKATYTKFMHKEDGYITIEKPPLLKQLDRMIRAYFPWPGVWTKWNGKIVKLLPEQKIQVEGKKPMSFKDFSNGYKEGKGLLEKLNLL